MPMLPRCRLATAKRLPSGAEGRHAAALPVLGRDELFLARGEVADERLIVLDEDDRLAVRRPASLRALVTNFGSEPSRFISQISGKPPRRVVYRIRLPSGEKRGSASGSVALGELLRVLAAGVHAPDFHDAAAIADEDDRALEAGQIDACPKPAAS